MASRTQESLSLAVSFFSILLLFFYYLFYYYLFIYYYYYYINYKLTLTLTSVSERYVVRSAIEIVAILPFCPSVMCLTEPLQFPWRSQ